MGTAATVITILTALGVGSTVTAIVNWLLNRKRTAADITKTEADLTAVLSKASGDLVLQYQAINSQLADDLAKLRTEFRGVEEKLDQVLDAVDSEKRWATANGHDDAPVLRIVHQ